MTIELSEKRKRRKNERNAAMYDQDVFDLLQAIDAWRRKNDRQFPAWSEVITIMKTLGWRKVAAPEGVPDPVVHAVQPLQAVEPMATAKLLPTKGTKS